MPNAYRKNLKDMSGTDIIYPITDQYSVLVDENTTQADINNIVKDLEISNFGSIDNLPTNNIDLFPANDIFGIFAVATDSITGTRPPFRPASQAGLLINLKQSSNVIRQAWIGLGIACTYLRTYTISTSTWSNWVRPSSSSELTKTYTSNSYVTEEAFNRIKVYEKNGFYWLNLNLTVLTAIPTNTSLFEIGRISNYNASAINLNVSGQSKASSTLTYGITADGVIQISNYGETPCQGFYRTVATVPTAASL